MRSLSLITGLVLSLFMGAGLLAQPTIAKSFNPTSVSIGQTSTLTFTINNPAASAISGVAFTDTFPANLFVGNPNNLVGSCGSGTITAAAGSGSVTLSGGTIAAGSSCTFSVDVIVHHQSTSSASYVNTTSNVTASSGTGNSATDTLTAGFTTFAVSKGFSPNSISAGGVSTLIFTITSGQPNPTVPFIDQVADLVFQDVLPAGLVIATPNGLNLGTCAPASPVVTAVAGSNTITLGNQPLFAGGGNTGGVTLTNSGGAFDTCSFSVNVTAAANGTYLNTITTAFGGAYPLVSNDGNAGSATLTVASSNTPPVANDDAYAVNQGTTLNVAAPGVLANDTDVDAGDTLHAVLVTAPSYGSLTFNSDGSFSYVPNAGFACLDSFTYKANDGTADSNVANVSIMVNDTQGPSVSVSTTKSMLWPPNHDLVDVGLTFSATDNGCTGPASTSVAVYSTEDDVTQADGDQSPDAKGSLLLRAERDARKNGRVYLIRVTSTDASNNTTQKCAAVTVPHSMSAADVAAVNSAASAAVAACTANGMFLVGDGPVIGPKQ